MQNRREKCRKNGCQGTPTWAFRMREAEMPAVEVGNQGEHVLCDEHKEQSEQIFEQMIRDGVLTLVPLVRP
jgi:hypothetical protein